MKLIRPILLSMIIIILGSCATKKNQEDLVTEFDFGDVLGMVYDSENRPCHGALITIATEESPIQVRSDINGRFLIPDLSGGIYTLTTTKEGYEPNIYELDYSSRKQVLYIRLTSLDTLLDLAESSLDSLEWSNAHNYLLRASSIESEDSRYQTLIGAYSYRTGDYHAAVSSWQDLVKKGHRDPYLYLMIADAYQYKLNDSGMAIIWLRQYLDARDDPEVQRRYDEVANNTDSETKD